MLVALITLSTQLPSQDLGVGHEARGLLRKHQLRLAISPRLQAVHALIGLHYVYPQVPHQLPDAWESPGLRVSGILMEEHSSSLNLFLIEFRHELHVTDPLGQLLRLSLAIWDQRLELAECHARWATYPAAPMPFAHLGVFLP